MKEYTKPILKFNESEFEDILLISMVDEDNDIFDFYVVKHVFYAFKVTQNINYSKFLSCIKFCIMGVIGWSFSEISL